MSPTESTKHRVNITIDRDLHGQATAHARVIHHTDFSGLVTQLLVEDIRTHAPVAPLAKPAKPGKVCGKKLSADLREMFAQQIVKPAEPMPNLKIAKEPAKRRPPPARRSAG